MDKVKKIPDQLKDKLKKEVSNNFKIYEKVHKTLLHSTV